MNCTVGSPGQLSLGKSCQRNNLSPMESQTASVLYESVASEISTLINSGTLEPGDRVPSVRRLSQQKRVSISTVLQAYAVLENRGLIEARPQSGYYVRAPQRAMEEPATTRPP